MVSTSCALRQRASTKRVVKVRRLICVWVSYAEFGVDELAVLLVAFASRVSVVVVCGACVVGVV